MFWVESELEKEAILADESLPFFTTSHFDGHPSVLVRGSRIAELSRDELTGFIERAWLSRAGPRAVAKWMKEHGTPASRCASSIGSAELIRERVGWRARRDSNPRPADPKSAALIH